MPFGKKKKQNDEDRQRLLAKIAEAVLKLDPNNDEHWTADDEPAMAVLESPKYLDNASITREDVEEASPEASREWVRAEQARRAADKTEENITPAKPPSPAAPTEPPAADDQEDKILLYGETMRTEKSEPLKPVALVRGYKSDEAGAAASDFAQSCEDLAPKGQRGWAYHLRPRTEEDDVEALPIVVRGEEAVSVSGVSSPAAKSDANGE